MKPLSTVYRGTRDEDGVAHVTCGMVPLAPRWDLKNHSPTGLEWGYGGSGPAQLALALLADFTQDPKRALAWYQPFKWRVVAHLPKGPWTLTGDQIEDVLAVLEEEARGGAS